MDAIRLVLVDDHRVVRRGLRSFLEACSDVAIVGEASSGEALLERIESWLPDVVVMDILMPGGIDGIEATRRVRAITPHTQVVVLTAYTDDARVVGALRAGAIGYVRKDADPQVLLDAVRAAARGQSTLDPAIAGSVLEAVVAGVGKGDAGPGLTGREVEVLRLLAHGRTNREIAGELVVSPETIKTHVGNILSKLHLAHRTEAVVLALKRGLVSLEEIDLPGGSD
jgi:NarL family two-component system response regulator LiaR